ncbi:MAG: 60S ribosomal export protein NMD3 [Halobacteriales archaeon]
MTDSGLFCPRCGAPVEGDPDDRPLPPDASRAARRERSLCDACYLEAFDLVDAPETLRVRVCAQCGAVHRGERWVDVGAEDYTDVAVEAVRESLGVHVDAEAVSWSVAPEQVDPSTVRVHATFNGVVRGTAVEESVTVPVTIARETCTRCGRIAGDAYAGTVQVRAAGRDPSAEETERAVELAHELVAEQSETGDREAFVTEVAEVDGGVDVKLSTTRLGERLSRRLVAEFGGSYDAAETLVTEDGDGNPVYRVAYAVRLPRHAAGDVIDPDDGDGPVLVEGVHERVSGRRLATGEPFERPADALADARTLGALDDAEETTLVAVEDEHAVQVLDPETYEAKTVPRPADLDADADTVRVLKHRGGLHVVPDRSSPDG